MIYFCCDERRRALVRDSGLVNGGKYNGIDFLEIDTEAPTQSERQHKLRLHFLKPLDAGDVVEKNLLIEGGERIRSIEVNKATVDAADHKILVVEVGNPPTAAGVTNAGVGDFSIYTLRLVQDAQAAGGTFGAGQPPKGFDSVLSAVPFSFKIECPSDFDCRPARICPPESAIEPEIDYLAKDYNSFRQLMLDRMSVLVPQWSERNAADLGVALVELLAYVGDHLSYEQDAVATEAYLDTARRRVSVRRHALLVDYFMHDGCNARAWIQFQVSADNAQLKKGARLITSVPGLKPVVDPDTDGEARGQMNATQTESFETMQDATFFIAHNEMEFYTWSEERCCLPAGATSATLKGNFPNLGAGEVLIFEEIAGPLTGNSADADPAHRHAVRLTKVESSHDPIAPDSQGNPFDLSLTEIQWHTDDALPFALCISARTDADAYKDKISVAHGNVVLADHGRTFTEELGAPLLPRKTLATVASAAASCCEAHKATPTQPRFRPQLKNQPLTQAAQPNLKNLSQSQLPFYRDPNASATASFRWEMRSVLPAIQLEDGDGRTWKAKRDLLSSDGFKEEFVAEVDDDGRATLRFGDDQYGLRPMPGVEFVATYRVGNGSSGNVGAEALVHVITKATGIVSMRNPMAARGGADPESIEHVRRVAPDAFRIQERAVTPDDYAAVALRHREVQDAAATVRWTGSWLTIFLTIDRLGGRPVDAEFEQDMRLHLERYRLAGQDVEIDGPQFVALEIEITVCVQSSYFRSDVKAALLRVFSNQTLPDGSRGVFHPDNFSFGQPVYLSRIYAAAQQVEGVRFVTIDTFQRLGSNSTQALDDGVLMLGRLEIARLDNDPNFAERGVFRLNMEGGK
jgi:Baseplate J-like protein